MFRIIYYKNSITEINCINSSAMSSVNVHLGLMKKVIAIIIIIKKFPLQLIAKNESFLSGKKTKDYVFFYLQNNTE